MTILPEISLAEAPDRIVMLADVDPNEAQFLADAAVDNARVRMPRVTGYMASTLQPMAGVGYFGIYFPDRRIWFMERGTRPFTMRSLPRDRAIPMWVNDPDGSEAREIRKHSKKPPQTRVTEDGRRQVLIFRRVAPDKSRKTIMRDGKQVSVPRSYPGAPGRISARRATGQIATGNVGVRWRHPGVAARMFLNEAVGDTAFDNGFDPVPLYLCDNTSFFHLIKG